MTKQWFLEFDGKVEGPFSVEDLKNDERITPETLVWRIGFDHWVPIKDVPELKDVLAEGYHDQPVEGKIEGVDGRSPDDELALDLGRERPPLLPFFLIIIAAVLFYLLYHFTVYR